MIKLKDKEEVKVLDMVLDGTDHTKGILLKTQDSHYLITQDLDYKKFVVIEDYKIQIFNEGEIEALIADENLKFVKWVELSEIEIKI